MPAHRLMSKCALIIDTSARYVDLIEAYDFPVDIFDSDLCDLDWKPDYDDWWC